MATVTNKKKIKLQKMEAWPTNWASYSLDNKKRYIEIFTERCDTGYAGITGKHYFYQMVGHLKTPTGQIIRPLLRDMDILANEENDFAKKQGEDLAIAKRRGYALTSMFGGGYAMYNAMMVPGSISILTSADAARLDDMYTNKLRVFYQHMPVGLKEPILSKRQGKMLHFGKLVDDDIVGLNSQIICIETADGPSSPSKLEAARAIYIFLDEVALHPYADKCVAVGQATISDDGLKLNPFVIGGSSGIANPRGLKVFRDIWFDNDSGYRKLFIEGDWCMSKAMDLDKDGKPNGKIVSFMDYDEKTTIWKSNRKAAQAWIQKTRLNLFKAKNKTKYYQFCKAYPLHTSEYFDLMSMGYFTEDVESIIINSSVKVLNNPPTWVKHYLYTKDGKVFGGPDESKGFLDVLIPPRDQTVYGAGCDPIPFQDGQMETVKGSSNSLMIGPMNDPVPHARMSAKSMDADDVAEKMILSLKWYNDSEVMFERNRAAVLMSKFKEAGAQHLLANQPTWFGHQYFEQQHRHGYYYGTGTMDKTENELVEWIRFHLEQAQSIELLDNLKVYKRENTDDADAWKAFLVHRRQYLFKLKLSQGQTNDFEETLVVRFGPNGERYEKWETRILSDAEAYGKAVMRSRPDYIDTRGESDDD